MTFNRSVYLKVAGAALGLAALGASGLAQARDHVYWSVGVDAAPGVSIGIGNSRPVVVHQPVYVQPQPVYVQPQPVYSYPQPIYHQQPTYQHSQPYYAPQPQVVHRRPYYVQPAPVYVRPAPIFVHGGVYGGGGYRDGVWKHQNRHDEPRRHRRHHDDD